VRGAGRETKMASYLDRNNGKTFWPKFEVIVGGVKSNETEHRDEILLEIINKLEEVRLNASKVDEDVLLYAIDMTLSHANKLLSLEKKRIYS
jgi:hypothetical protein